MESKKNPGGASIKFALGATWPVPEVGGTSVFFPEDLPSDWRLPYLLHFWPDILLMQEDLAGLLDASPAQEGPPEGLRIYIQAPDRLSEAAMITAVSHDTRWTAAVAGQLLTAEPAADAATHTQGRLYVRQPLESVGGVAQADYFHLLMSNDYPANNRDRAKQVSGGQKGNQVTGIWRISPLPGLDLPGWRDLLASMARATPPGLALIFLDSDPGSWDTASTLLRLLGLAAAPQVG